MQRLTALEWFKLPGYKKNYNDIVRLMYEQLYNMNIGCDIIDPASDHLDDYKLLIVPALYAAPDSLLERLNAFVTQRRPYRLFLQERVCRSASQSANSAAAGHYQRSMRHFVQYVCRTEACWAER